MNEAGLKYKIGFVGFLPLLFSLSVASYIFFEKINIYNDLNKTALYLKTLIFNTEVLNTLQTQLTDLVIFPQKKLNHSELKKYLSYYNEHSHPIHPPEILQKEITEYIKNVEQRSKMQNIKQLDQIINTFIKYQFKISQNETLKYYSQEIQKLLSLEHAKYELMSIQNPLKERQDITYYKGTITAYLNVSKNENSTRLQQKIDQFYMNPAWKKLCNKGIIKPDEYHKLQTSLKATLDLQYQNIKKHIAETKRTISTKLFIISSILLAFLIFVGVIIVYIIKKTNKKMMTITQLVYDKTHDLTDATDDMNMTSKMLSTSSSKQQNTVESTKDYVKKVQKITLNNVKEAESSLALSEQSDAASEDGRNALRDLQIAIEKIDTTNSKLIKHIEKSHEEFDQVVEVINSIEEKTKIINEIVFQTKILSFNASIEAARAGEHGKGFSVVAEEIGVLAGVSGNASREISELILESSQKVDQLLKHTQGEITEVIKEGRITLDQGTLTAFNCSAALDKVIKLSQKVNDTIEKIAVSSREQHKGIEEVQKSFQLMNDATKDNLEALNISLSNSETLTQKSIEIERTADNLLRIINGDLKNKRSLFIKIKPKLKKFT